MASLIQPAVQAKTFDDESSEKNVSLATGLAPVNEISSSDDTVLGPLPTSRRASFKHFVRSLGSKDAWLGDYDYISLMIPSIPYITKPRDLPFYGAFDRLPHLLALILGLQHALAMVGGIVTPPLLLGGAAGANLGTVSTSYLVSACLIWCGIGTAIQVGRIKLGRTGYYVGTGIISVTGTSFAFVNVGLSFINQQYGEGGMCSLDASGNKLPCPEAFGSILGTACVTGLYAIALSFVRPRIIRALFPPLVTGTMLSLIGAALVSSAIKNWGGGSGNCFSDTTKLCTMGSHSAPWGSAEFIGLGFASFITIIVLEIFGSPFMKSASVFLGLLVGMIIGAATGYFNEATIASAPSGNFLWTHTFPLKVQGQLVLPMLAAWTVIIAETIANVTASCDVSRLPIEGSEFETRVQGGMLADSISATLAGLAMIPPLTTFSQNAGVISLTRNASRVSGFVCAAFLFIMGVIGKFVAVFVALPASVLGGFTTFIFGSVFIAGIRILAYAQWNRRTRFIATCAFSPGLASLVVPTWFSHVFTYKGNNSGLNGLIQAIVLIVEEPYLIAALISISLNAVLPAEGDETAVSPSSEEARKAWNQHHTTAEV